MGKNIYADRAVQRKAARNAGRSSKLTKEARLTKQCQILADRLAIALAIMTQHEEVMRHSDVFSWIKYMEDWAEALSGVERAVPEGRVRPFDYRRNMSLYRYHKNAIRALVRAQVQEDEGLEVSYGDESDAADAEGA